MGSVEKVEGAIKGLDKNINTLSGAIHTTMENLQSPINKLVDSFEKFSIDLNKSSDKTNKLTRWLVIWTAVMAFAIIVQIFTIIYT